MEIKKREGPWFTIWEIMGAISTGTYYEVMATLVPTNLRHLKEHLEYTLTDDLDEY